MGAILKLIEWVVPIGGDIVENVQSKDGGVGRFFTPKFAKQMVRLIMAIALIYMVIKGQMTAEDAVDSINAIK